MSSYDLIWRLIVLLILNNSTKKDDQIAEKDCLQS